MRCLKRSDKALAVAARSAEETRRIGELLGRNAYPGLAVLLLGDLGMGKTVLTQGIGKILTADKVKSPSFIIVSEHDGALPLTHVDLYRLESARESDALDLDQYTEGGVLVVEWAERWASAPEEDVWRITFSRGDGENDRLLSIEAMGARAQEKFSAAANEIAAACEATE